MLVESLSDLDLTPYWSLDNGECLYDEIMRQTDPGCANGPGLCPPESMCGNKEYGKNNLKVKDRLFTTE